MAMLANRVWVWVFQGTASDRRTGFVEMNDANARNAIVGGRAQDPMLGALKLKHIIPTVAGGLEAATASKPPAPPPAKKPAPPTAKKPGA